MPTNDWTELAAELAELDHTHPSIGTRLRAVVRAAIAASGDPAKLVLIHLALDKAREELEPGLELEDSSLKDLTEILRTDVDRIVDAIDKIRGSLG
jgi:hypothetical protein